MVYGYKRTKRSRTLRRRRRRSIRRRRVKAKRAIRTKPWTSRKSRDYQAIKIVRRYDVATPADAVATQEQNWCYHMYWTAPSNSNIVLNEQASAPTKIIPVCYDDALEFQAYLATYNQYRIKGMGYRFVPAYVTTGSANTTLNYAHVYDTVSQQGPQYGTSKLTAQFNDYTKFFNPAKMKKGYINVTAFLKSKNFSDWIDCDTSYSQSQCQGTTMLFTGKGFTGSTGIGTLYVTYYIHYRQPRNGQQI